jgi:tetratricopeptide (TPR) repeat protein
VIIIYGFLKKFGGQIMMTGISNIPGGISSQILKAGEISATSTKIQNNPVDPSIKALTSEVLTVSSAPKVTLKSDFVLSSLNELMEKKDYKAVIDKTSSYLNSNQISLDMSTKIKLLSLRGKAKFSLGDMPALLDLKQALALQPSPEQKSNILFLQGATNLSKGEKMDVFNSIIDFTSAIKANEKVFTQNLKADSDLTSDESKNLKSELLKFAESCKNTPSTNFKDLQTALGNIQEKVKSDPVALKALIK